MKRKKLHIINLAFGWDVINKTANLSCFGTAVTKSEEFPINVMALQNIENLKKQVFT